MAFKKGKPKTGGRKKGSGNIKKLLKAKEYLASNNINPIEEILNILPTIVDPIEKVNVWFELLKYCEPMLKPAEESKENLPNDNPSTPPENTPTTDELYLAVRNG
jgi:hypothetical protein